MKNIKRIGYIVLVIIIIILSFTIYTNASKDHTQNQKDKTFSQIKYMEGKIVNLLNSINHIEARNYSVVTSEMSKETQEKSNSQNSSSSKESEGEQGGGGSSEGGSSSSGENEGSSDASQSGSDENTQNKKI